MRIELERRSGASRLYTFLSPFIALALTLVCGFILFAALGKDPFQALYLFFIDPLREEWSLHELAIKAGPLILIGAGLSICYRAGNWNIGAEGQFIFGGILGSVMPVMFAEWTGPWLLPLMLIMGMIGGAAYAAIPALLKTKFNTSEILSSLMLVYVAQLLLDWLVRGPWRNPGGMNFPETRTFDASAVLPAVWESSGRAHWGFVFAIAAAVVLWFMMEFTLRGYQVKVLGQSVRAGRFAGLSSSGMIWFSFLLSGALAGLAGIAEVSGAIGQLRPSISPGYGFTAIIVAFLGRLNPLGAVVAGLVLALTYLGGEAAQLSLGLSDKVTRLFQVLLLFFVLSCDTLILYRIRLVRSRPGSASEGASS